MPDSSPKRPRAAHSGILFGVMQVHMLSDGRHIVTQRGVMAVLTGGAKDGRFARLISRLPNDIASLTSGARIDFEVPLPQGGATPAVH